MAEQRENVIDKFGRNCGVYEEGELQTKED